jgi:uncharacterized RDD family membrane protein YckC
VDAACRGFLTDAGIALPVGMLAGVLLGGDDEDTQATVVGLTCVGTWILVTSVAMGIFKGQTVGKRLVGTRVVIEDRPVGFGFSLLRDQLLRILYFVPLFFFVDSRGPPSTASGRRCGTRWSAHVIHAGATPARAVAAGVLAAGLLAGYVALDSERTSSTSTGSELPGYSTVDRQAFVESCQGEGAAESYCTCLYDYISARVPYDTFASITSDKINEWPAPMRDATIDGVSECS